MLARPCHIDCAAYPDMCEHQLHICDGLSCEASTSLSCSENHRPQGSCWGCYLVGTHYLMYPGTVRNRDPGRLKIPSPGCLLNSPGVCIQNFAPPAAIFFPLPIPSTPADQHPQPARTVITMASAMRLGSSALRASLRAPAFRSTSFTAARCYSAKSQVCFVLSCLAMVLPTGTQH